MAYYDFTQTGAELQSAINKAETDIAGVNVSTDGGTTKTALTKDSNKEVTLLFDTTPTNGSNNPITSGAVYSALGGKLSPMAIETISGTSLTAAVNTYYVGTSVGTLAVTLPTPTGAVVQSIIFYLETGATPNVTFSHGTTPVYSDGYQIDANAKCEINALWNGSVWIIGQLKLT